MKDELNVKAGDKVLYRIIGFAGVTEEIKTVTKVTRTGRIKVEGRYSQFDKYGCEIGSDPMRYAATLSIPTEEDYKRIEENAVILKALSIMKKMDKETLPYDKAVKIIEILGEGKWKD